MKKNVALLLMTALVVMLFQQVAFTEMVSAEGEQPIYPTKDKFHASGGSLEGETVYNGFDGKNYIGFDSLYGEQVTYLQFSLASIVKQVESVYLVIPIPNGYVFTANAKGNTFIDLYTSEDDGWDETSNELPDSFVLLEKQTVAAGGATLRFDVTAFIKSQRDSSDNQATFALKGPTESDVNPGEVRHHYIMLNEREQLPGNAEVPHLEYVYSPNSPPTGAIDINNGAACTNSSNVTLSLTSSDPDSDPVEMQFSNDNTGTWSTKEPFNSSKTWALSAGDGTKTVHMRLIDQAGHIVPLSDSIVLDTTPPVVTGVTDGQVTNQNVTASFSEGTAALNGSTYTSGTAISTERDHTLVVTDSAGNAETIRFTIDTTAPAGTLAIEGGKSKINKTNVDLAITSVDASTVQMRFSNTEPGLASAAWIAAAANHSWSLTPGDGNKSVYMELRDAAGNTNQFSDTIIVDTVPPAVTGVNEGDKLNAAVSVTFDEGTALLDGSSFTSGSSVSSDGVHKLVVTDEAGNATMVNFSIDKTPPAVTGVSHGELYHTTVTPAYSDGNSGVTATLNEASFASGTPISADGDYELIVTDAYGNSITIKFEIDKTPPAGSLSVQGGNVTTGSKTVTLTITGTDAHTIQMQFSNDNNIWSALESFDSTKSWSLTDGDGAKKVYLRLTDAAGNTAEFSDTIVLDTSAPAVTGIMDGEVTKNNVTIAFNEGTATLNGNPFVSNTVVSGEGEYELVVKDDLEHSTTLSFTIDKTVPTGSILINAGDINTTSDHVTITYEGEDLNAVDMQMSNSGTDWLAAARDWQLSSGFGPKTVFLKVTDAAGNTSTFTDTIVYRSVPVLTGSSAAGSEDLALSFSADDFVYSNADGEALDVLTIETLPENGKLQFDGTDAAVNQSIAIADIGKLQFVPAANWSGATSFEWTASADTVAASAAAVMAVTLAAVNDAPTAEDLELSTTASAKLEGHLAAADVEPDTLTYAIVDQPAIGELTLDAATGAFSFKPKSGVYDDVTFTYKANDGHADSNTATVTIKNTRPPGSGTVPTTPPIKIEGIFNHYGVKVEVITKGGQEVFVITIGGSQVAGLIAKSDDKTITIDTGTAADNVELVVDRDLLNELDNGEKTIELVMNGTGYGLSSSAIREVLRGWDDSSMQLKIEIKQADQASADKLEALAEENGYELLVTPMRYQLYFQKGDSRIDLTKIKGYITIAYGEDELKEKTPKTAVLLLPNGNLVHVPTKIDKKEGNFEIKVHSFANGVFTLIDYEKSFSDVSGWAKIYVEELASRLIVQGTGEDLYEPNRSVTRAEFASIITGALGLYHDAEGSHFADVSQEQWFAASLTSASEFGLISGYADGTFRPNGQITREEAMVILARALQLMEIEPGFSDAELQAGLAAFEDSGELKSWSKASAGLMVRLDIVNGSGSRLNPGEPMTRAQLAAVIVKLLTKGQFIESVGV